MTVARARRLARLVAGAGLAAVAVAGPAAPAPATVTVDQQPVAQGAHATIVFNVRSDRPDVSTTGLEITLPPDHGLTDVLTQPKPGWVIDVEKAAPGERVSKVRWSVAPGQVAIGPSQFDLFAISVGPLPSGAPKLAFQAVQTYSDGQAVAWSATAPDTPAEPAPAAPSAAPAAAAESPAPQPEETPLPAVELAAASDPATSQAERVTLGLSVGIGLILIGVAGAAVARRRGGSPPAPSG